MYCVYTALWYQIYDQNNFVCSCSFCFLDLHPKTLASSKAASSSPRYLVGQIHTGKCSFQLMLGSTCFNKIPIRVLQLINMLEIFKVSNVAKWISKLLNIPGGCNSKTGFILHFCVKWTYHQNAWSKKSSFWFSSPAFLDSFRHELVLGGGWNLRNGSKRVSKIVKPLGLHIFT